MTEHHALTRNNLVFGVGSEVSSLPPGFRQTTLLHFERGLTEVILGWGQQLQRRYNTTRVADLSFKQLSYWTGMAVTNV